MQRRRAILIKPAQAGQQPTHSGEMSSVLQGQVKLKGCGTQKAPLSTKKQGVRTLLRTSGLFATEACQFRFAKPRPKSKQRLLGYAHRLQRIPATSPHTRIRLRVVKHLNVLSESMSC